MNAPHEKKTRFTVRTPSKKELQIKGLVLYQFDTLEKAEKYIEDLKGRSGPLEIVELPHNPIRKKTVRSRGGLVQKTFGYRQGD